MYIRQLRDVKLSAIIEDWDFNRLREYGKLCGWVLAKAHARSGDSANIAGYMGASAVFDGAICEFAVEYADQNHRDYRAFVKAVREGRIPATVESEPSSVQRIGRPRGYGISFTRRQHRRRHWQPMKHQSHHCATGRCMN